MRGQRLLVTGLVGFVSFLSGGWLLQRGDQDGANVYQKARLFDDVIGYVADYYVDSLSEATLYDKAIDGLLNELDDPYATFLRADDFRELTESTTGNYGGLGIRIDVRDDWITIIAPIAGTPAEEAGLQTGDRIVEVDGRSTRGWKNDKAVSELRGEPGSTVRIGVARPGIPEIIELTIERAEIHVKAIQAATVLGGDVGYVSLVNSSVSDALASELVEAIDGLTREGATSLILDLRSNPGGLLDEGVAVTDLFLERGDVIVSTKGRARGTSEAYQARRSERWPTLPIVVLVNEGTASAAEIIAGALQDHDRALIVGTPTFGKGVVQTVFRLGQLEALRLTTARWYTPSGRTIERLHGEDDGVDVAVAAVADTADEVFHTQAGRVVRGGGGIQPDLLIEPDTLTDAEQRFARELGAQLPVYRDVMTSYALELKGAGTVSGSTFDMTAAMRDEFLSRLRARGVEISDASWGGAARLVDRQVTYEVIRYVFGREVESRRRATDDAAVQRAVQLLQQAKTPSELLALAVPDPQGG